MKLLIENSSCAHAHDRRRMKARVYNLPGWYISSNLRSVTSSSRALSSVTVFLAHRLTVYPSFCLCRHRLGLASCPRMQPNWSSAVLPIRGTLRNLTAAGQVLFARFSGRPNRVRCALRRRADHMSTAVRNVVRAIPVFNGKHRFLTLRIPATLLLPLWFSPQLITSSSSTLTRSSMPIRQAAFKGHIGEI
jgi:hypothetical protein